MAKGKWSSVWLIASAGWGGMMLLLLQLGVNGEYSELVARGGVYSLASLAICTMMAAATAGVGYVEGVEKVIGNLTSKREWFYALIAGAFTLSALTTPMLIQGVAPNPSYIGIWSGGVAGIMLVLWLFGYIIGKCDQKNQKPLARQAINQP